LLVTAAALAKLPSAANWITEALLPEIAPRGGSVVVASAAGSGGFSHNFGSVEPRPNGINAVTSTTVTFQQGVSSYTGAVDTFIDAGNPTTSNATNVLLTTDGVPPTTDERQTIVRFDNIFGAGPGQIPVGATITSATLRINVSNSTQIVVNFNRLKNPWNATDTWNTFVGGIQADDVEAVSSPDAAPGTILAGLQTINVTAGLQAWAASPSSNYGWVLRTAGADTLAFDSSEVATSANRPLLSVTYDVATSCVNNADCNDGNPCTTDSCDLGTGTCSHPVMSCAWGTCAPSSGTCEVTLSFQNGVSGYSSTVDTYLDELNPALNHGTDASFFMDNDPTDKQGLIRFDGIFGGNGSSQIPPGSTIRSATLTVNVNDASDTGAAFHRMLACWNDTNTWTTFGAGIQADGIEAVATPDVPSTFNNGTPPILHPITVTNSVAAWSAGAVNLGWVALPLGGSGWGVDSAQGTIKPQLSVTFTPPAACTTDANCNDGNGCTTDTCNTGTGFCNQAVNVGGSCTDGVACTNDTCSACGRCASADNCTLPNVCNTGTGLCASPPSPPNQPTNASPADGATGVSTSPQLCVDVSDPNGDPLDVTFKGREGGGGSGTPFTVIAMPDTQFYSESFPATYVAQTTWVRDNRIARTSSCRSGSVIASTSRAPRRNGPMPTPPTTSSRIR
jgi:hypothetical protein